MRDLLFRDLTSFDRKRKILASSEIFDKSGVRTIVRRHFIYMVKELPAGTKIAKPIPATFICKERNTKEKTEKFFCRIKSSLYVVSGGKVFFITFMHSLRICLTAIPDSLMKYI